MPSPETDPSLLPAHILASEIAARRLSPVDLVDSLLSRIRAQDEKLHASVVVYGEAAWLAAEAPDTATRSGRGFGRLPGVPMSLMVSSDLEGGVASGG